MESIETPTKFRGGVQQNDSLAEGQTWWRGSPTQQGPGAKA